MTRNDWKACYRLLKSCVLGRKVVICVRSINCLYNNIAKGIRLLDNIAIFVYIQVKCKSFWKQYPLNKCVRIYADYLTYRWTTKVWLIQCRPSCAESEGEGGRDSIQCLSQHRHTSETKRHLNGVSLTGRWWHAYSGIWNQPPLIK